MTTKLVISKENNDARNTDDIDNHISNSDYDTLKYHISGSVQVVVNGTTAEGSIGHGLGYVPFFIAYVNNFATADGTTFAMCPGIFLDFVFYTYANSYADDEKIYFRIETNIAVSTFTFYYKVFRNNTGL